MLASMRQDPMCLSKSSTQREKDADFTEEKAEVYDEEAAGPLLNIPPIHNALSIVFRDSRTLKFVKYVSKKAPSSRVDVRMTLQVIDDECNEEIRKIDEEAADGENGEECNADVDDEQGASEK